MFAVLASQGTETNDMRKLVSLSLLLFCSSTALGEDRWRISVLAAEISTDQRSFAGSTAWAKDPHAGVSLGIAYAPVPEWDVELTVATQTHRSPYTRLFYVPPPIGEPPGPIYPATEFRDYRVNPMDLSVTRHFRDGEFIAPYVRAGVRYVSAPDDPGPVTTVFQTGTHTVSYIQVFEGFGFEDRLSAQAGAGVLVRLTDRAAVRAEATRLLRDEQSDFDPLLRYAVGLSWAF
jgi:hypothetical protein